MPMLLLNRRFVDGTVRRSRWCALYRSDRVAFEAVITDRCDDKDWYFQTLPTIEVSMQLAQRVYDTFGPGPTDPTEAVS